MKIHFSFSTLGMIMNRLMNRQDPIGRAMPCSTVGSAWRCPSAVLLLVFISSGFLSACAPEAPQLLEDPSRKVVDPKPELDRALHGYIDKSGSWAIQPQFVVANSFAEGLAHVVDPRGSFIDKKGQFVIKEPFYLAGDFHEGLAWAAVPKTKWEEVHKAEDLHYGFIDKTGKFVIKPQYNRVTNFSEGMAFVQEPQSKKWGFIDKKGTMKIKAAYIIPINFKEKDISAFKNGSAVVCTSDHRLLSINKNARTLDDNEIHEVFVRSVENSEAKLFPWHLTKEGKVGYIDPPGNYKIPNIYLEALPFRDGLALVKKDELHSGFIDKNGRTVIDFTDKYDFESFSCGLSRAKEREGLNWGYIDKSGKVAIPFKYPDAEDFSEGLASAELLVDSKRFEQIKFPFPCPIKELLEFSKPSKEEAPALSDAGKLH